MVVAIGLIPLSSFAVTWSQPVLIGDSLISPYGPPDIEADKDGDIWVTWTSENLYARYYNGNSWSETMSVPGGGIEPQIAVDSSNNIWVIWSTAYRVHCSHYDGVEWSPREQVCPDTGWSNSPSIIVTPSGEIWAAYMHGPMPYGSVFRAVVSHREEDGWSSPTIVSGVEGLVLIPYNTAICSDGEGGMWAAWMGIYGIMGSYYDDGEWGEPVLISTDIDISEDDCWHIKFTTDLDGRIWGCYDHASIHTPLSRICVNRAEGDRWMDNPLTVCSSDSVRYGWPDISVDDSGKIWVVYDYHDTLDYFVFSSYFDGDNWSSPALVSIEPVIRGVCPVITKDNSGNIWSAWRGWTETEEGIYANYCNTLVGVEELHKPEKESDIKFWVSPNPFTIETSINLRLASDSFVSLKIYDIAGRLVSTVINCHTNAGHHIRYWNGRDRKGIRVRSGVYLCKLQVGEKAFTRKVTFLGSF